MKISKEAKRQAREILRASFSNGRLDPARVSRLTDLVITNKPRKFEQTLKEFARLVRLEAAKHHAVVQSAAPLDTAETTSLTENLKSRFGTDITIEFQVKPELLGGLRIQVGSDVWDGSVQNRLNLLTQQL